MYDASALRSGERPILVSERTYIGRHRDLYSFVVGPILVSPPTYIGTWVELYRMAKKAIWLYEVTSIKLLLRVGIKVADEWQISLGYVRGSNIYVRGYLDLRAWSLRLRA